MILREDLANGCRLALAPTTGSRTLSLRLCLEIGSRHERTGQEGVARLTQELLLKGAGGRDAAEIAESIESVGGSLSVTTTHDHCNVAARILPEHADRALELLADLVYRPTFPEDEFEAERARALTRLRAIDDHPAGRAQREFFAAIFEGHPYERPTLGREESLRALTLDDVKQFHADHYHPNRATLVAVGEFEPEALIALARQHLEPVQRIGGATMAASKDFEPRYRFVQSPMNSEQAYIYYGFPLCQPGHPDYPALRVASAALGEGMASRLFLKLRDEQGLAYEVGSRIGMRRDAAYFAATIGTTPDSADAAIGGLRGGIRGEIRRLTEEPLSPAELDRARNHILGKRAVARQSNHALSAYLAQYEMLGLGAEADDRLDAAIRVVTVEDVQRVARKYFTQPAIVLVGPPLE